MEENKMDLLLNKLSEATERREMNWLATADESKFAIDLDGTTVEISLEIEPNPGGKPVFNYVVYIKNEKGKTISVDFIDEGDSPEQIHESAERLYNIVRENVLKPRQTVDRLLELIDKKLNMSSPARP